MRGVTGAEDRGGVTGAEDRGAVGAEGCGVWGGSVPLPTGGGVWRGGYAPSPEFFKNFTSRNGVLWCILGVIFYSSGACCTHVSRLYIGTYI